MLSLAVIRCDIRLFSTLKMKIRNVARDLFAQSGLKYFLFCVDAPVVEFVSQFTCKLQVGVEISLVFIDVYLKMS